MPMYPLSQFQDYLGNHPEKQKSLLRCRKKTYLRIDTSYFYGYGINILRCCYDYGLYNCFSPFSNTRSFYTPKEVASYLHISLRNAQRLLHSESYNADTTLNDKSVKVHEVIDNVKHKPPLILGHYRPLYIIDNVTFQKYVNLLEFKGTPFEQHKLKRYKKYGTRAILAKNLVKQDYLLALYKANLKLQCSMPNMENLDSHDIREKAYDYYFYHSKFNLIPKHELKRRSIFFFSGLLYMLNNGFDFPSQKKKKLNLAKTLQNSSYAPMIKKALSKKAKLKLSKALSKYKNSQQV